MKQNPNALFFSHAVGRFSLEDEMKELNKELINLSLDLEKKNTGVIKSNIGGYQSDFLQKSNRIIGKTKDVILKSNNSICRYYLC